MTTPPDHHGLAWRISCDSDLQVVIAVFGSHILLNSAEAGKDGPWRIGFYKDAQDAQDKAVQMTASYERLRAGHIVGQPTPVILEAQDWRKTVEEGSVISGVADAIMLTLVTDDLTQV